MRIPLAISSLALLAALLAVSACTAPQNNSAQSPPVSPADRATRITNEKLDRPLAGTFTAPAEKPAEFSAVLDWFAKTADVKLQPDWNTIEQTIPGNTLIAIDLHDVTARHALELILQEVGFSTELDYKIESGVIRISTTDALAFDRAYEVADLIEHFVGPGANSDGKEITFRGLVRRNIYPRIVCIYDPTNDPYLQYKSGKLVVHDTEKVHAAVEEFLADLRTYKNRKIAGECRVFISPKPLADLALPLAKTHREEFCFTQEEMKRAARAGRNFNVVSDAAADELANILQKDPAITTFPPVTATGLNALWAEASDNSRSNTLIKLSTESTVRTLPESVIVSSHFQFQFTTNPGAPSQDARSLSDGAFLKPGNSFYTDRRLDSGQWAIILFRSKLLPEQDKQPK